MQARAPTDVARWMRFAETGLFFLAALMCLSFVSRTIGTLLFIAASCIITGVRWASATASKRRARTRPLGLAAWLSNLVFHLFAFYLAVVCAATLAWTMPWWTKLLAGSLLLASAAPLLSRKRRLRLPVALAPGVLVLTCGLGWHREEGIARCDDRSRVLRQRGVELLFPSTTSLDGCAAGDSFPIRRFPRKIWESPDGARYVLTTTQPGDSRFDLTTPYDGLFCEVSADGTGSPHCVGGEQGKAHEIDDIAPLDQLFSCAWGMRTNEGHRRSVIYRLSRTAPLTILSERNVDDWFVMYGFYDPQSDEYHPFTDECGPIRSVRGSDFSALPDLPMSNCPGATLYDAEADEGIMCGGHESFVAFRLHPWTSRPIGRIANPTERAWLSWGCDWDRRGRKVYATVANLGLLATIDYDTGRVERTQFVGFGLRSVAFDKLRRRIYVADFLGGNVLSIDADSGAEVSRWFVGHYIRELQVSRDHSRLLTTSNLGIVRLSLD